MQIVNPRLGKLKSELKLQYIKYLNQTSGKKIKQMVINYCDSLTTKSIGHYRYSSICPETIWASAFAALVLNLTGGLDRLSITEKELWANYLNDTQDEETGLFIDLKYREKDQHSQKHTSELFHLHSSTFVMGALNILGGKPRFPISWVHKYRNPEQMQHWLKNLPWDDPWLVGNWAYDIGCAMGMDFLVTGNDKNLEAMSAYFDWYDLNQLKDTGWWSQSGNASLHSQQYGGYHTLMVYRMFGRPVRMVDKMIDSSLSLQHHDGMFGRNKGGGCCEDMDVIDTLVSLGEKTGYRENDIKSSLQKALFPILAKQNSDGGFYSNNKKTSEFGWALCSAEAGMSDLCSTLFQLFTILLIGEFLNNDKILNTQWNHHTTYCHCERNDVRIA